MILSITIPIDLPSGGRLEIDVEMHSIWYPPEGDGRGEPRYKGYYEQDWYQVISATWCHATGSWTTIKTPPGSIAHEWLGCFLDERFELLVEAIGKLLTERT